jgi:hypothetical protein
MIINPFKKAEKKATKPVIVADKPVSTTPDLTSPQAPAAAPPTIKIDLDKPIVKEAIEQGRMLLKDGKSKADAARVIFSLLKDEEKNLIVAAFVDGATLTEKGALTYFYNCKRKQEKLTPKA